MGMRYCLVIVLLFITGLLAYSETVKLKEIATVCVGEELIQGYGLVVGLKGTGDSTRNYSTAKTISDHLREFGLDVAPTNFFARNSASVVVSARISRNLREGVSFDVNVSSLFDARSLEGGFLLKTPLKDSEGRIVGFAQGNVTTPKGSVRTTGVVPNGGILVLDLGSEFENRVLKISFDNVSPSTVNLAVKSLREKFSGLNVRVVNLSCLEVEVPEEFQGNEFEFIAKLMETEVDVLEEAFVVVDQKSATVVITGDVKLYPVSVSYKGMKVISSEFGTFFESGEIYSIPSTSLKGFVDALSKIGVKAEDLIQILLLMRDAGGIKARFIVK
ncbi:MAG: flagellar basal body P-ring protein FlgI [Brevinematia bacterium]